MAGVLALTDEERLRSEEWTEIDGDLKGVEPGLARAVVSARVGMAKADCPRSHYRRVPEDVDCFDDIPYLDDGIRGHKLDVYLPHDAVLRGGHALPVYVDIHGGGFTYGYKELNRNFNVNLAEQGFAVLSLSYRPFPQIDFLGQLRDIFSAFSWIGEHLGDYPVDSGSLFITGDSAGGTLGLYALAIESSDAMSRAFGIERSGLRWKGAALVSGLFDLTSYVDLAAGRPPCDPAQVFDGWEVLAPAMFRGLVGDPEHYVDLGTLTDEVELPSVFLNTSSDDFIECHSLRLASELSRHGRDFELHDVYAPKGWALGHVYPVCMSWLPESQETLRRIREFSYGRI